MAKPRPTIAKRQRERARLAKKQEKARLRGQRREDKKDRTPDDPLEGIVAGPQPTPEWMLDDEDEVEATEEEKDEGEA